MSAHQESDNTKGTAQGQANASGAAKPNLNDQLLGMAANIQEQLAALTQLQAEAEAKEQALLEREQALAQRTHETEQRLAQAQESVEQAIVEQRKAAEQDIARTKQALHEQASRHDESARAQQAEIDTRMAEIDAQKHDIAQHAKQADEQQRQLASTRELVVSEQQRLEEFEESLNEQSALQDSERAEAEAREKKLHALKDHLEKDRRRITEREAALKKLEDGATGAVDEQAARITELEKALEHTRSELATASSQADTGAAQRVSELETQLADFAERTKSEQAQLSEGYEKQVTTLREQLDEKTREATEALAQVETLASQADCEAEDSQRLTALAQDVEKRDAAITALRGKLEEAGAEIESLRSRPAEMGSENGTSQRTDRFNTIRRQRLGAYKKLLRQQAVKVHKAKDMLATKQRELKDYAGQVEKVASQGEEVSKQVEQLAQGRQTIAREQAALEKVKRKVAARAARSSATVALLAFVVALAIIGAGCWVAVDRFVPATFLTSVTLGMEVDHDPTPEQIASWQSHHEKLLDDPQLLDSAADRLRSRGFEELGTVSDLRGYLNDNLDASSEKPGELSLTLKGEGAHHTTRILETLVSTLRGYSNDTRDLRPDRSSMLVVRSVAADERPIEDPRLQMFAYAFGGGSVFALLLLMTMQRKMLKSKREFEAATPIGEQWDQESLTAAAALPVESAPLSKKKKKRKN